MSYSSPADRIQEQIKKYSSKYSPGATRRIPTQAEREVYQYVLKEQEERDKKRKTLHPVEAILDLLSRGQYVTANMTQNIVDYKQGERENLELGKAALEGLTGKRKGDYTDILKDLGWEPETKAGRFARGATGFLANVLLDPTTYIGFGPTKAARGVAKSAADDYLKLFNKLRGMNIDEIPESILKAVDPKLIKELADQSPEQLAKYLAKHGGDDTARMMNQLYKNVRRDFTRMSGDDLAKQMKDMALETRGKLDELEIDKMADMFGGGKDLGVDVFDFNDLVDNIDDIADLVDNGVTPQKMMEFEYEKKFRQFLDGIIAKADATGKAGYAGAGTRSWRYLGKDVVTRQSTPEIVRAFDKARKAFQKSKIGGLYSDAVWKMFDNPKSVVGKLKKAFNVRNPYQQALEAIAADVREEVPVATQKYVDDLHKVLDPLSDEEKKIVRDRMIQLQMNDAAPESAIDIMAHADPVVEKRLRDSIDSINGITDAWQKELEGFHAEGLIKSVGDIENYLPIQETGSRFYKKAGTARGHFGPGPTRTRELTWAEHQSRQIEKLKWILGVDTETAEKIVSEGLSDLNMDLEKMLVSRAIGQAKIEARVQMLREFRGFGIHVNDLSKEGTDLLGAITREGATVEQLGLRTIQDHALRNYLFDNDVARVLERSLSITNKDESIQGIAGWIRSFNNMWKGWATMSPGFHSRNEISNNIIGFLNHGAGWFNPENAYEALICTTVGLYGEEAAVKSLSKTLGRARVIRTLAKQYGDRSLRELTDYATKKGIITRATMGFDLPSTVDEFLSPKFNAKKLNVFSSDFAGIDMSRKVGSLVESQSKMTNFLLDYKEIVKLNTSDAALDWAKMNTKKWFFDYADLSEFEQKYMKSVIPFYTWIRKNIAAQISGLVELTPMYSTLAKELSAVQDKERVEKEALPEYMRELGYIPTFGLEDGRTAMFWPNIPLYDLNKIPFKFEFNEQGLPIPKPQGLGSVIKEFAASANPALKTLVEVIPEEGWHTFYQTPLGKRRQAPGITQAFKEDGIVVPFIDGLLRSLGVQKGLNASTDEKGNLLIDAKTAQILENNLLQLKRIPEFFDAPELLIPALRDLEDRITGKEDEYDVLEELFKVLSFNLGIKFKAFDEEEYRRREAENLLREAEEARAEDRRSLPQAQQRRSNYITNRLQKQRRMGLL